MACLILSLGLLTASAQLQPGVIIEGHFNKEEKTYVAEVISVNGKDFTCRFVHSSSEYTFLWRRTTGEPTSTIGKHEAVVGEVKGGNYPKGTPFAFQAFVSTLSGCHYGEAEAYPGNVVIVKFSDGKRFLGDAAKTGKNYSIRFRHSGSVYIFNDSDVVIKSGGAYKAGSKTEISCVESIAHF